MMYSIGSLELDSRPGSISEASLWQRGDGWETAARLESQGSFQLHCWEGG